MIFTHGRQLAIDLSSALGFSRAIRSIVVKADCRESASVTIEFVPTPEESRLITAVLKSYQLVQVEPIETRHFDV